MIDFINSIDKELKTKEIFKLFKTDILEFDGKILSILEKYPTTQEFIHQYTKIDIKNIYNKYNNLLLISSQIIKETDNDIYNSDVESYICGISKIILFFYLIQKTNVLLLNLVKNTKEYTQNFFIKNQKESLIKVELNAFINELINSSQFLSTKIRTIDDTVNMNYEIKENENNILNSKTQTNKYETLLIRTFTPTFKDIENPEPKNNQLKDIKDGKRDSAKLDSNLTLQKMNFIQYEEEEKINKKPIKKYNSHKIKKKKYKSKSISTKESLFNNNGKNYSIYNGNKNNQRERKKILVEFFDLINFLYKVGKINSNQKINMKQIIISNPKIMVEKFYKYIPYTNQDNDKILINKNLQKFLYEEFKFLK